MRFVHRIDEIIIESLQQSHGKLGFNELLAILRDSYPNITRRVLSRHLNLLEKQAIIERDQFMPGVKRNSWLSVDTKWMLTLGWGVEGKSKWEEEGHYRYFPGFVQQTGRNKREIDRNKKVCILLMFLATFGSTRVKTVVGKAVPGDIYLGGKARRQFIMPGVSVSDFFLKYRDISNACIFSYIRFHKKSEVEWYFNKLEEFDPPIIGPIDDVSWFKIKLVQSGLDLPTIRGPRDMVRKEHDKAILYTRETRYVIANEQLYRFFERCIILLHESIQTMEIIWRYKNEPTDEERRWFVYFYGERRANQLFMKFRQRRFEIKNIQKQELKDAKNRTKNYIIDAHAHYQLLIGNDYEQITKDYKFITNAFLELVYPRFMLEMYKRES